MELRKIGVYIPNTGDAVVCPSLAELIQEGPMGLNSYGSESRRTRIRQRNVPIRSDRDAESTIHEVNVSQA